MNPPVRMVFISLTACLTLIIFFLVYRFIYPQKKLSYLTILILLALLPVISLLRVGSYESGDFTIHVYRSMSFFKSLSEGYILPSWSQELNASYGYPLFVFVNPLAYYINSFFHTLGFSFVASMKLFLALTYIFSGITMYLWVKEWLKNTRAAFTAGIIYLFSPYHLVDFHFRATVGEMLIFCLLPLLLYCITKVMRKPTVLNIALGSLTLFLVIISHQAVAVFCCIFALCYVGYLFIIEKHTSSLRAFISMFVVGIVTAGYVLVPHLIFTQYVVKGDFKVSFPKFWELLYSPWRYGLLFQGRFGELAPLIGYTQLLIIIVSTILLTKQKKHFHFIRLLFWVLLTLLFIFMLMPISSIVWQTVPLIKITLLSTRLLIFVIVCVSILAALLSLYFSKKSYLIYLLLCISIGYTILNWGHRRVIPEIGDIQLQNSLPQSTYNGEGWGAGVPKWQGKIEWEKQPPQKSIQILTGTGTIKEISRKSEEHQYISSSQRDMIVQDNTWYFPGWHIKVDNREHTFLLTDDKKLLKFLVPAGIHYITIYYKDLYIYTMVKIVSLISLITILIIILYQTVITRFFIIKYKR